MKTITDNINGVEMTDKIFAYLKHEEQLLGQLIELAERHQQALVKLDTAEIEHIASQQEQISKNLREIEQQRLKYFMNSFRVTHKEALAMSLTELEKYVQPEIVSELRKWKDRLNGLLKKLLYINGLNRILANRARNSVRELISLFTNGSVHVCNVKI